MNSYGLKGYNIQENSFNNWLQKDVFRPNNIGSHKISKTDPFLAYTKRPRFGFKLCRPTHRAVFHIYFLFEIQTDRNLEILKIFNAFRINA